MTKTTSARYGALGSALALWCLMAPMPSQATAVCSADISSATQSYLGSATLPNACSKVNGFDAGGQAQAESSASPGLLRAKSSASTNSSQPDEGTALGASARARITDRMVVQGLDSGAPVLLTFAIGVGGSMEASSRLDGPGFFGYSQNTSAIATFVFDAVMDNISNGDPGAAVGTKGCVFAFNPNVSACNGFNPQPASVVDTVLLLSILVSAGDVLDLSLELSTTAGALAQAEAFSGSAAQAGSDFSHTIEWLGLQSATVGGRTYTGPLSLQSDSGFDYLRVPGSDGTVPEPSSLLLAVPALLALGVRRAGRRQTPSRRAAS